MIFCYSLKQKLEVGEHIEADDIYFGEAPTHIICAASCTTQEEELKTYMQIEGHHEALKKHVKSWGCLKNCFVGKGTPAEKLNKHNIMFCACVVVKQVAMEMGIGDLYKI